MLHFRAATLPFLKRLIFFLLERLLHYTYLRCSHDYILLRRVFSMTSSTPGSCTLTNQLKFFIFLYTIIHTLLSGFLSNSLWTFLFSSFITDEPNATWRLRKFQKRVDSSGVFLSHSLVASIGFT